MKVIRQLSHFKFEEPEEIHILPNHESGTVGATVRERLLVFICFSPFYIRDGRIASSMAVYHSTIFCY